MQDLLDRRYDVKTTDEMFGAICDHLKHATNGGTIRSTITVFRQVSEYISHNLVQKGPHRYLEDLVSLRNTCTMKYPT